MTALTPDGAARLDLLRAMLAIEVVVGHLSLLALPPFGEIAPGTPLWWVAAPLRLAFRFGPQAALLFIMLSGFLVGGPLLQARIESRKIAFAEFARKRLLRITPVLWLALLLTAALDAVTGVTALGPELGGPLHHGWPVFWGNALGLMPTLVPTYGANGPLWTLGYLVQFYFVGFALLVWCRGPARVAIAAGLLAAMAVWRPECAACFALWLLGAGLRAWSLRMPGALAAMVAMAGVVTANLIGGPANWTLCAVAGAAALAWAQQSARQTRPWAGWLAARSYGLYAVHLPVAVFLAQVWLGGGVASGPAEALLFVVIASAAALMAGAAIEGAAGPLLARRLRWSLER